MIKIGVFDSGIGGLTVVKEIKKVLPSVSIIYIGDTARVPWGVRSPKVIREFSLQLMRFLEKKNASLVVVACHTASSIALPALAKKTELPFFGVIDPTVDFVIKSGTKRVGILGTPATIKSKAWEKALNRKDNKINVYSNPAPLLVPIVEEGLQNHEVAQIMVEQYTKPLLKRKIDTLVLACTHYPLLESVFRKVVGSSVDLVNPGLHLAEVLADKLEEKEIRKGQDEFYFTDLSGRIASRLQDFYGGSLEPRPKLVAVDNL